MMRNEIAALHARTNIYRSRLNAARRIIAHALETTDLWYIGFSGGKDSTVVAALVHEQAPDIPLLYGDEEWLLPESEEYLQRTKAANPTLFHRIKAADWHAEWFQTWQEDPDAIHSSNASGVYARNQGWTGAFLGLRQEESSARTIFLRKFGPLFFSQKDDCWQCNPLSQWGWKDIWAYIISHGLDYNCAYDRLEEIGVLPDRQRIGPLAVERILGYGQMAILKRGWPDLFNRFAERFPEARLYT